MWINHIPTWSANCVISEENRETTFALTIIRQFEINFKVYSSFKDKIWGNDVAAMRLISKYNKGYICK